MALLGVVVGCLLLKSEDLTLRSPKERFWASAEQHDSASYGSGTSWKVNAAESTSYTTMELHVSAWVSKSA